MILVIPQLFTDLFLALVFYLSIIGMSLCHWFHGLFLWIIKYVLSFAMKNYSIITNAVCALLGCEKQYSNIVEFVFVLRQLGYEKKFEYCCISSSTSCSLTMKNKNI